MKRITVSVDEDIDLFFRKFASQKFRFKRGWYSKAVMEAMELWINQYKLENNDLSGNFQNVGMETWEKIKGYQSIDTEDICDTINSITNYFTKDIVYAENIKYKIEDNLIEIFPKDTQKENIIKLININDGKTDFNCPIALTIEAALADLVGEHYNVISSEFQNHSKTVLNNVRAINSKS